MCFILVKNFKRVKMSSTKLRVILEQRSKEVAKKKRKMEKQIQIVRKELHFTSVEKGDNMCDLGGHLEEYDRQCPFWKEEEELRSFGVGTKNLCKNLIVLFLALFLFPIDFILKLKLSNLLMVFLNLALLMLRFRLETARSQEVVEDSEDVENIEFAFEELERLEGAWWVCKLDSMCCVLCADSM